MKFLITIFVLALSLNAQTLATVNKQEITVEDVNSFLKATNQEKSYKELDSKAQNLALHQTIEKTLLIQEAKKERIDSSKEYKDTLEEFQKSLLVEFFYEK